MERERSPKYLSSQLISFSNIRLSRFCLKEPVGPDPPVNPLCAKTTLFKVFFQSNPHVFRRRRVVHRELSSMDVMYWGTESYEYYKAFPYLN